MQCYAGCWVIADVGLPPGWLYLFSLAPPNLLCLLRLPSPLCPPGCQQMTCPCSENLRENIGANHFNIPLLPKMNSLSVLICISSQRLWDPLWSCILYLCIFNHFLTLFFQLSNRLIFSSLNGKQKPLCPTSFSNYHCISSPSLPTSVGD